MTTAATSPRKPSVFIIEDDGVQRTFLREVLTLSGYECVVASSCEEARQHFHPGRFACALVDLGLPDGNGLSLLPDFTRDDAGLVVVVLTGDASADTVIDTMRVGAFDYLTKPVDITTLTAAVTRAIAHHSVINERAELLRLLLEEREQLRARVEAATADIRQYASACELSNARLRALLQLVQLSGGLFSDEALMVSVFQHLSRHLPLRCIALCDVSRGKLVAASGRDEDDVLFTAADVDNAAGAYDQLLAQAPAAPQSLELKVVA